MASGTTIKVLYFAQVAEIIGKRTEDLTLKKPVSVSSWLENLRLSYPEIGKLNHLQIAINQEHSDLGQTINPGDEVAVFEPVTGG